MSTSSSNAQKRAGSRRKASKSKYPKWVLQITNACAVIAKYFLLVGRLLIAKEMPLFPKAMFVILSVGYVVWFDDIIIDSVPFLGRLDDVFVVFLLSLVLVFAAPKGLVEAINNQV